jgi:nitroreductase/uncharacterized protein YciI
MLEFAIFLEPLAAAPRPTFDTVRAHCERLNALAREGRYIAGGPLRGSALGGGLILARFDDLAAATSWAQADPFVTTGFEQVRVQPWEWSRPENGQLDVLPPRPGSHPAFIETLRLRATMREFSPEPLPQKLVADLIDVALCAPSEFNLQPWRPVVCHAEADRLRLQSTCMGQPQIGACGVAVICAVDPAAFGREAPRVVDEQIAAGRTAAADRQAQIDRLRALYAKPDAASVRHGVLFGHQLLLAGLSVGLAGFWLGGIDHDQTRAAFGMSPATVIAGVVGLGYPKPGASQAPRPRRKQSDIVGWGRALA